MEKNIVMPRLRPEMEKGVLCAWLKDCLLYTSDAADEL